MEIGSSSRDAETEGAHYVDMLDVSFDDHGGAIINMTDPMDENVFVSLLRTVLLWANQRKKGVWLKLSIEAESLVPTAVKEGFIYHDVEPTYFMLKHLIPDIIEAEERRAAEIRKAEEVLWYSGKFNEYLPSRNRFKEFFTMALMKLGMSNPPSLDIEMQNSENDAAQGEDIPVAVNEEVEERSSIQLLKTNLSPVTGSSSKTAVTEVNHVDMPGALHAGYGQDPINIKDPMADLEAQMKSAAYKGKGAWQSPHEEAQAIREAGIISAEEVLLFCRRFGEYLPCRKALKAFGRMVPMKLGLSNPQSFDIGMQNSENEIAQAQAIREAGIRWAEEVLWYSGKFSEYLPSRNRFKAIFRIALMKLGMSNPPSLDVEMQNSENDAAQAQAIREAGIRRAEEVLSYSGKFREYFPRRLEENGGMFTLNNAAFIGIMYPGLLSLIQIKFQNKTSPFETYKFLTTTSTFAYAIAIAASALRALPRRRLKKNVTTKGFYYMLSGVASISIMVAILPLLVVLYL